jgi:hypothetical protein
MFTSSASETRRATCFRLVGDLAVDLVSDSAVGFRFGLADDLLGDFVGFGFVDLAGLGVTAGFSFGAAFTVETTPLGEDGDSPLGFGGATVWSESALSFVDAVCFVTRGVDVLIALLPQTAQGAIAPCCCIRKKTEKT